MEEKRIKERVQDLIKREKDHQIQEDEESFEDAHEGDGDEISVKEDTVSDNRTDERYNKNLEASKLDQFNFRDNENVFFLEVKRPDEDSSNPEKFKGRFLCAFESAAAHNLGKDVYVLIDDESSIHLYPDYLKTFPNLNFVKVDFDKLAQDTPASDLWNKGDLKTCAYAFYNKGNFLRFALMLKYGGLYMDTDVITLKGFQDIPNFAVEEGLQGIASAVIKFGKGHPFIKRVMENMQSDFQGDRWGYNGPHLIARSAVQVCNETDLHKHASFWKCPGFPILPHTAAFPVAGYRWKMFYQPHMAETVRDAMKESFVVHYWNHASKLLTKKEELRKDYPLYEIFRKSCPLTEKYVLQYEKLL